MVLVVLRVRMLQKLLLLKLKILLHMWFSYTTCSTCSRLGSFYSTATAAGTAAAGTSPPGNIPAATAVGLALGSCAAWTA